jgi:cytochrome c553
MLKRSFTALTALTLLSWGGAALSADVAAGQAKADEACGDCHDPADWEGESAAAIEGMIKDVVAGKVKHKGKIELSEAEIANIAAFWGGGG